jgi:hypothetical protein
MDLSRGKYANYLGLAQIPQVRTPLRQPALAYAEIAKA